MLTNPFLTYFVYVLELELTKGIQNHYYKIASNTLFSMKFAQELKLNLYSLQKSGIVSRLTVTEQNHKIGRKKDWPNFSSHTFKKKSLI